MSETSRASHMSLRLAQALWAILAGLGTAMFILGVPAYHHQLTHPPHSVLAAVAHTGLPLNAYIAYLTAGEIFGGVLYLLPALFIAYRRFTNVMGLFMSAFFFLWAGGTPPNAKAVAGAFPHLAGLANSTTAVMLLGLVVFLFTFPDGRVVPRWATIPLILFVAASFGGYVATGAPVTDNSFLGDLVLPVGLAGLASQAYRYRRVSDPQQRQQTKWVLFGLAFAITVWIPMVFAPSTMLPMGSLGPYDLFSTTILGFAFGLIPVTITIAILRYRLWDIDVLINRALVYGSLTLTLAGLYLGGVIGLQALFGLVTGQSSQLAIAISTLAIAALFNPWRKRLQAFIDRRFYRRKYDAAKTLAAFQVRLRDEVDLDQLSAELVEVVHNTMQPARIGLWLPSSKGEV